MSEQDPALETINSDQTELESLREGIDDPLVLRDALNKRDTAYRQVYARAKKAEEENRELKAAQIKAEPAITPNPSPDSKPFEINDEVVDLRLDGYSKPEVEYIMKNGGRKELEDTSSYLSIAINTKREQKRAEEAASQTTESAGLSEIERKYTKEQLANMSVKELEAILPRES